jgi:hypothetical protein
MQVRNKSNITILLDILVISQAVPFASLQSPHEIVYQATYLLSRMSTSDLLVQQRPELSTPALGRGCRRRRD